MAVSGSTSEPGWARTTRVSRVSCPPRSPALTRMVRVWSSPLRSRGRGTPAEVRQRRVPGQHRAERSVVEAAVRQRTGEVDGDHACDGEVLKVVPICDLRGRFQLISGRRGDLPRTRVDPAPNPPAGEPVRAGPVLGAGRDQLTGPARHPSNTRSMSWRTSSRASDLAWPLINSSS